MTIEVPECLLQKKITQKSVISGEFYLDSSVTMDRFWGKKNESVLDHVPSQRAEVRLAAIKKVCH